MRAIQPLCLLLIITPLACCKPGEPELYPEVMQSIAAGDGKLLPVINTVQYWKTCGPAALTNTLKYIGIHADHDILSTEMDGYDGVTNDEMIEFAKKYGAAPTVISFSESKEHNWKRLTAVIDSGYPAIVGIVHSTCGYTRGHFMTVVGYSSSPRAVIVHNGKDQYMPLSWKTFYPMWEKHRMTLVLMKKDATIGDSR